MARVILELGEDNQHLFVVRGTQYHGEEKAITLGGADQYMYMSIPEEMIDGYLPNHPDVHLVEVEATEELYEKLKNTGECAIMDRKTRNQIEEKYPLHEELKALRTGDEEYSEFVANLVLEAKNKKRDMFGLPPFDSTS